VKKLNWMTCIIVVIASIVVTCWRSGIAQSVTEPPQKRASQQQSFEGKVLLIYGAKPEQNGVIVNARIERLGDVDFLVGNVIDEPAYQWKRNLGVYIKLDQVNSILVYNSMDEYTKSKPIAATPQR